MTPAEKVLNSLWFTLKIDGRSHGCLAYSPWVSDYSEQSRGFWRYSYIAEREEPTAKIKYPSDLGLDEVAFLIGKRFGGEVSLIPILANE